MQWTMPYQNSIRTAEKSTIDPVEKKLIIIEARKNEIYRGIAIFLLFSTSILFLRILLRLFGANPQSLFAGIVYVISTIFLLPFLNILPGFHDMPIEAKPAFDASAFIAIFCYVILGLLVMGVTYMLTRILRTERQVNEVVKKDQPVDRKVISELLK